MNKSLWMKVLESHEEDKLASLIDGLSDEEKQELANLYDDEEKTAGEGQEAADVEKVADDYYAAGKLFAKGFIDTLNEAGE